MTKDVKGVIGIYKPQGYTSHDCVAIVRKQLGIKRVGHTGTLDPMATGVLCICVGSAARIMDYTDWDFKRYICTIRFGIFTDTEDIWGELVEKKDVPDVSEKELKDVMNSFLGAGKQLPPMYSAIKVKGKKLYEYAREKKDVDIVARDVYFKEISILDIRFNGEKLHEVDIEVECSKGTYIRSLCRDIGKAMGTAATMSGLKRISTGAVTIEDTVSIEDIKRMSKEEVARYLKPTDVCLTNIEKLSLPRDVAKRFVTGQRIRVDDIVAATGKSVEKKHENTNKNVYAHSPKLGSIDEYFRIYFENQFLGIAKMEGKILKADKVFDVRI